MTTNFKPATLADFPTLTDAELSTMRQYRLNRIRAELKQRDYAGILLYDPLNIRYATDTSNMQVWCTHNAVRYCFIPTEGPVTLFEFHGCDHLAEGFDTLQEVRSAIGWFYFGAGSRVQEKAKQWAAEIADLVRAHGGGNRRLAVDKCEPEGIAALQAEGVEIFNGQEVTELARRIKSPEEIKAMRIAIAVNDEGFRRMEHMMRPGLTENAVWSVLHQANIELGGEWIETRLLAAGSRTNPWFQECSNHVIENGDLVCLDSDLIGPYGYCADVSRSWYCGDGKPNDEQRQLFETATKQLDFNQCLLKPGMTFNEFSEQSYELPEDCIPNRYSVVAHGVGLCDEYPAIVYASDLEAVGYEGLFEPGMTICLESYVGRVGGREGVKLEQQVLVTDSGNEVLSPYPLDESFL
ncbi:MAG: Xaa-Pro peptidase family protein [SAR324 cluster bacterium]|nr:Xaa-Pro peptidase family protein [SAR324 cluster bacterium]